ncbi:MAG: small multi-drug export protein [Bacilli bacterium]|nr:small multi-drug export protein [Bacilli bacterium]
MKYLIVFLISMVPIVELRGAVPIGLSDLFGPPLDIVPLYIICIIGNMIPVPFIFFFARKVLEWGANKKWPNSLKWVGSIFKWLLNKGEKGGKKLTSKTGQSVYVALMLFVGIPLPGTGAWTGTLAASLLDLDFKKSVVFIVLGVLLAGIIMGLVSAGVFNFIF